MCGLIMKFALVTGGSRGIGRAISIKIVSLGYHVLVNYKSNDAEASQTLSMIEEAGGSGELLRFDVSDLVQVTESLGKWHDENREATIEVLINNAGIRKDILLMWMEDSHWNDVINTNLNSFFYVTRFLLKNMLVNKYGRIVNIVSLSGLKGLPGQVNYSAAKAAVIGATKALAQEIGKKNVTVNAVAPGFIRTDMTKDLNEAELKNLIPLNRFGLPEEVAEVVCFLASAKASYITGQVISVNGGLYT
jgi:3-oxoacyl-[acyl-carrier protein] reductase